MDGKGPLIVLALGLIICAMYFGIYGFSLVTTVRWGQYLGLVFVSYCFLNEIMNL
jgi:hypothetical protein